MRFTPARSLPCDETRRVFGFEVATACPEVPSEILWPENTWTDPSAYLATAKELAEMFNANFEKLGSGMITDIRAAGPVV